MTVKVFKYTRTTTFEHWIKNSCSHGDTLQVLKTHSESSDLTTIMIRNNFTEEIIFIESSIEELTCEMKRQVETSRSKFSEIRESVSSKIDNAMVEAQRLRN